VQGYGSLVTSFRFCDETEFGFGWVAEEKMRRCSHALVADGKVWLTDTVAWPEAEERARALGEPAGVLQLLDRHNRDCADVAARLGVPHVKLAAGGPFEAITLVRTRLWTEIALWWGDRRVLVTGDALGTFAYWTATGERLGVHPLFRLFPPRKLGSYEPEHVLNGHGEGLHEDATRAVREALRTSRRRALRAFF
jgi:hypothetical protein